MPPVVASPVVVGAILPEGAPVGPRRPGAALRPGGGAGRGRRAFPPVPPVVVTAPWVRVGPPSRSFPVSTGTSATSPQSWRLTSSISP
jgi:hypothetical protein